jgi:hypothetical protein
LFDIGQQRKPRKSKDKKKDKEIVMKKLLSVCKRTPKMKTTKALCGLALLALAGTAQAAGPTSTLYLTAGAQSQNLEVPAGTTTAIVSAQEDNSGQGEYAIAVSGGTIRTGGNGEFGAPALGSTYDLNFNYIGPRLANPGNNILDGTTDGSYNYGVDFSNGNVYRCNLDWSSPTFMFTASDLSYSASGITYDPFNNSLWIGAFQRNFIGSVSDYSMTGTFLSSFTTTSSQNWALAFDGADGTLWGMALQGSGIFNQYSTSGVLLQTINIHNTDNILGGEFALVSVPEPTGLSLLAFGMFGIALLRRRK